MAALALAAALSLLSAYVGVLRDVVHQGDLRREAAARHSAATWRCQALKGAALRDDCLRQLNTPAPQAEPMAGRVEHAASIRP